MYSGGMDTNILKYQAFVKSAETRSFTKAAASLHYTQGGVSRMIADLENEWQVSLFSRGKKGLELTADGRRLLPYAEGLCASFERLAGEVSDLRGLGKGTIGIGAFSSVATYWLPSLIAAFQKDHPGISYQLKLGDYEEIEGWINDGEVDCGFVSLPSKTPLDCLPLAKDEAVVVLPEGHPLCAKERISLQDLSPYPFLMLEDGKEKEFASLWKNVSLDVRFRSWDDYSIMAMVEKGLGVSVLPSLILKRSPFHLVTKPLDPSFYREIGIAVKDRAKLSAAAKCFLTYLSHKDD
jgi:DNA-binding transcriptional LysR family regulator